MLLCEMFPSCSATNPAAMRLTDPELFTQSFLRNPNGRTDRGDILIRQSRRDVILSKKYVPPTLLIHIENVLRTSSGKKVIGVDARRVVALVQNRQAFRNRAVLPLPGKTVCQEVDGPAEDPVSLGASVADPGPAFFWRMGGGDLNVSSLKAVALIEPDARPRTELRIRPRRPKLAAALKADFDNVSFSHVASLGDVVRDQPGSNPARFRFYPMALGN